MQVAITGANGYLGSHLAAHLNQIGYPTRALVRADSRSVSSARPVNFQDEDDIYRALGGCDTLVHLIAKTHHTGAATWPAYVDTNVALSLRTANAALKAKVSTFIFVSSVKALGEQTLPGAPFTHFSEPKPEDVYGKSKLLAEEQLKHLLDGSGTKLVVVRPPLIWGADSKGNLALVKSLVDRGIPLPIDGLNNRRDVVSLRNLCGFIAHLVKENAAIPAASYLVSDGRALTTQELIQQALAANATPPKTFRLPACAWAILRAAPLLGATARKLSTNLELDIGETRRLTGWTPSPPPVTATP